MKIADPPPPVLSPPHPQEPRRPAEKVPPVASADRWEPAPERPEVEIRFTVDRDAHETVEQTYDPATRQVIRETPPEQIRKLTQSLTRLLEHEMDTRA